MHFTTFEWVLMIVSALLISVLFEHIPKEIQEKAGFMAYCSSKGLSDDDCRINWEIIKNRQSK